MDPHYFWKLDPDLIRIMVTIQKLYRLKKNREDPWTLIMEAWRLKM
jgi:hypothetical protein